ncbi:MAG: hypothetical protein AB7G93_14310 [Bdellovibrionales bacterium]
MKPIQPYLLDVDSRSDVKVDASCIGVGTALPPEEILRLALDHGFMNLCQKDGYDFDHEVRTSENLIQSPTNFFRFPVSSVLAPDNVCQVSERALIVVEELFNSSTQKREALDTLINFMEVKGFSQTLSDDITAVADELFTNAVYNAPFVDSNGANDRCVSRMGSEVKYEDGKSARLILAHDESRIMVACEDPFGSLNLVRYMEKIKAAYNKGAAAAMNLGPGGAGLGSYIIFNAGSSLYFGVWPKRTTIVCCVIPLGMSYRSRAHLPKHFHRIQR